MSADGPWGFLGPDTQVDTFMTSSRLARVSCGAQAAFSVDFSAGEASVGIVAFDPGVTAVIKDCAQEAR